MGEIARRFKESGHARLRRVPVVAIERCLSLDRFRRYSPVEIAQQGPDGCSVLAGAVGDGVEGSDVATDALQPMTGKHDNRLRVALDNIAHQPVIRNLWAGSMHDTHILVPVQALDTGTLAAIRLPEVTDKGLVWTMDQDWQAVGAYPPFHILE